MKNPLKYLLILVVIFFTNSNLWSQALGTNPEEGRGTYKNRTFFNLERYWDSTKVCNNPHKGWTFHYYSNKIKSYGSRMASNDSLSNFPCLNDIYLRLAWSYLEPKEGVYNWAVIDSIISRWVAWGHTISFRITCKETEFVYATPEWVRNAGAKGKFIEHPELDVKAWAPDYDDPIFLEKLENFHKAFASRYDGKPWVEYIDIGSIGEWGEGHTAYSGWVDVPVNVVKKHIDIYKRCYKHSVLILSDDYVGQRDTDDGGDYEIYHYSLDNGIGFRDDSGNVLWYKNLGFGYSCIRTPELYSKTYKSLPVVLEADHYGATVQNGMWANGSRFEKAVHETHATHIGFHYYPHEWLNENYHYAGRLANLSGYWYFPKFAMMPDTIRTGSDKNYIRITWENQGVAPAYHKYNLYVKLINKSNGKSFIQQLTESDNRFWLPNEIVAEQCAIHSDNIQIKGKCDILIGMRDDCEFHRGRFIELAIKKERQTEPGWYKLGEVIVK